MAAYVGWKRQKLSNPGVDVVAVRLPVAGVTVVVIVVTVGTYIAVDGWLVGWLVGC